MVSFIFVFQLDCCEVSYELVMLMSYLFINKGIWLLMFCLALVLVGNDLMLFKKKTKNKQKQNKHCSDLLSNVLRSRLPVVLLQNAAAGNLNICAANL